MNLKMYLLLERNILNLDEINKFIENLSNRTNNLAIKKWLKSNLRNYLINNYNNIEKVTKYSNTSPNWLKKAIDSNQEVFVVVLNGNLFDKIEHVIHYFEYLNRTNYNYTVPDAIEASEEWTKSLLKKAGNSIEDDQDVELVRKYPDGYRWVKIISKNGCEIEGKNMDHCVGGYWDKVRDGHVVILSLRDENNKSKVTVEYIPDEKLINQIKGYGNTTKNKEFKKYILDLINNPPKWMDIEKVNDVKMLDVVYTNKGLIDIYDLVKHPNLNIKGSLYLSYTSIKELPDNLRVYGYLDLRNTSITKLPNNLTVGGSLDLANTPIKELPDNLRVYGDLDLYNTPIKELPNNLTIGGYLDLRHTSIKELPNTLKVGRHLNLINTSISSIPSTIKIEDYIYLSQNKKKSIEIPENLREKIRWD